VSLTAQPPLRGRPARWPPGRFGLGRFPIQVREHVRDDHRAFDPGNDPHCHAAGRVRLDINPDQIAGSDFEPPQAAPKGEGQDARSLTRLRRCAQVIKASAIGKRRSGE
jgi:hypothetical protein